MIRFGLGIDLGTSAVKAVAVDASGRVAASGEAAFPTRSELPGQAEQDPADWLSAVSAAVASIARNLGDGWQAQVCAIGLSGQLPTLVCMADGRPLGRAITWMDSRADAWAAERLDAKLRDRLYRSTGMPIDGRYLAPMLRFHWHDRWRTVQRILSAKDFLCHALTGHVVTDASTAAGYGVYALADGNWDSTISALWDLDPALLPEIRLARSIAGPLHAAGAQLLGLPPGIPVMVGAADSVTAHLAMGGLENGIVGIVMGSSAVIVDAVELLLLDPRARYLLTPHVFNGWFGREMDLLSTGTGFHWLTNLLGWTDEQLLSQAAASPAGAKGLFFAPYLAGGEQGALWNPELRGAVHGLTLQHTAPDIIDVLSEAAPIQSIVVAGHAARSSETTAMLADILRRPVRVHEHLSPAAQGAALLAMFATGDLPDIRHGQSVAASVAPGPGAVAYEDIYRRYASLFPQAVLPRSPGLR
jgi:xylulokinase